MDFVFIANQFLDTYGLVAIFAIMLLKEFGLPIPIPADLIMLGAAARAAEGKFSFIAAFAVILIPMVIGGAVQYTLARGPGRKLIYRVGNRIGLTKDRLDRAMNQVRRGGAIAVSLGLTTPGVRIAIVPASGLAGLPFATFLPGLIMGSFVFLGLHFAIGYVSGALFSLTQLSPLWVVGILLAALVLGIGGWKALRHSARRRGIPSPSAYGDWADAACPACLALALAQQTHAQPATVVPP